MIKPIKPQSKVKTNVRKPAKLDSKSFYFVWRILPRVAVITRIQEEIKLLKTSLKHLRKITQSSVRVDLTQLEDCLYVLEALRYEESEFLEIEYQEEDTRVFTESEKAFIESLFN